MLIDKSIRSSERVGKASLSRIYACKTLACNTYMYTLHSLLHIKSSPSHDYWACSAEMTFGSLIHISLMLSIYSPNTDVRACDEEWDVRSVYRNSDAKPSIVATEHLPIIDRYLHFPWTSTYTRRSIFSPEDLEQVYRHQADLYIAAGRDRYRFAHCCASFSRWCRTDCDTTAHRCHLPRCVFFLE